MFQPSRLSSQNTLRFFFAFGFLPVFLLLCRTGMLEANSTYVQQYISPQTLEISPMTLRYEAEQKHYPDGIQSRIFRGQLATRNYNFMCTIMHVEKSSSVSSLFGVLSEETETAGLLCGCTCITKYQVVTAAHCLPAMREMAGEGKTMEVWTGVHDISTIPDASRRYLILDGHDAGYRPKEKFTNDIAVLELDRGIEMSKDVGTCCIGTGDYDLQSATLLGFGLHDCQSMSNKLREAHGIVHSFNDCGTLSKDLNEGHICAKFDQPDSEMYEDQAPGDSGGPLFKFTEDGTCALIGTVSFNIVNSTTRCPKNAPSVFQRAGAHTAFFREFAPDAVFV